MEVLDALGRRYAVSQANFVFFHTGLSHAEFSTAMAAQVPPPTRALLARVARIALATGRGGGASLSTV